MKLGVKKTKVEFNKGEMMDRAVGSAYVKNRPVTAIAKEIRMIVKKAVTAGYMPKMTVSVKCRRSTGHDTINIVVTKCEDTIINEGAWLEMDRSKWRESWVNLGGRFNDRGNEIKEFLTLVASSFQKSDHHSNSDYSNANFYVSVVFCSKLEQEQLLAAKLDEKEAIEQRVGLLTGRDA